MTTTTSDAPAHDASGPARRRTGGPASLVVAAALVLAGCSAAEDGARAFAGSASSSASAAAVGAVTEQVCGLVEDGRLSESDLATLNGLVDALQGAGVDGDVLTAVEDVTGADGTPPESTVAELVDACA